MFSQCAASTTPKKLEIHSKLTRAVAADDKKEVEKILEIAKEEEINWRGIWGNTALHWAIANSNIHMAIFLLENTVGRLDVNTPDNSGKTALHLAIAIAKGFDHITDLSDEKATDEQPQASAILSLIEMTDLSIEDKKGYTPIHLAMMRRDVAVIEAMLEKEDVDLTLFTNPNSKNVSPLDLLECKYTEVRQSIDSYAHVFTFTADEWEEKRTRILDLLAKKISLPTVEYEKEEIEREVISEPSATFNQAIVYSQQFLSQNDSKILDATYQPIKELKAELEKFKADVLSEIENKKTDTEHAIKLAEASLIFTQKIVNFTVTQEDIKNFKNKTASLRTPANAHSLDKMMYIASGIILSISLCALIPGVGFVALLTAGGIGTLFGYKSATAMMIKTPVEHSLDNIDNSASKIRQMLN